MSRKAAAVNSKKSSLINMTPKSISQNCHNSSNRKVFLPRIMIIPDPEDCESNVREYTEDDVEIEIISPEIEIKSSSPSSCNRMYACNQEQMNKLEQDLTRNKESANYNGNTRMDFTAEFENDSFMGKYDHFREMYDQHESPTIGSPHSDDHCNIIILVCVYIIVMATFPFSMLFCVKIAQEYERAVIFRLGRLSYDGAKGPGIFFVLPCIESYTKVDLRTISFNVPPQEILTRDSVTVTVDAVVYYRICNAVVSVANVEDAHHSTRLLAQSTLRNVLGTKTLSEVLVDREGIGNLMQNQLKSATYPWGIQLERVEIKDCRLPKMLQRTMAAEAEAAREARAKEIASVGERDASLALKAASQLLADSTTAIQLRYLQTLINISNEKTSTIIFPLPLCLLNKFTASSNNSQTPLSVLFDNQQTPTSES